MTHYFEGVATALSPVAAECCGEAMTIVILSGQRKGPHFRLSRRTVASFDAAGHADCHAPRAATTIVLRVALSKKTNEGEVK